MLLIGFHDYPTADVYFFAFSGRERTFSNSYPYCRAYLYNFEHGKKSDSVQLLPMKRSPLIIFLFSGWTSQLQQQGYTNEQIMQYQQYYSQYMNQQNAAQQQWKFQAL